MRRNFLTCFITIASVLLAVSPGSLAWAAGKYKVLYSFTGGRDGGGLFSGVAFDSNGNLYGTTTGGGAYGRGTVFELQPNAKGEWKERVLHNFCPRFPCADGAGPSSTPVFDTAGNFYGTSNTSSFELSPLQSHWQFNVIDDNAGSTSGYTIDSSRNLYGANGGVWELSSSSGVWAQSFLYIFCSKRNCSDGDNALAPPTFDAAGNLYGTTEWGGNGPPNCPGSAGCGVVYQLHPLGNGVWKYQVIHRFAAFKKDGQLPYASVTLDSSGNVYGTTVYNGVSSGTVFELSPQSDGHWKETILYNFPNPELLGGAPVGGVTFDPQGNLYGTASAGGGRSCSCGVVFKMTKQSNGKWAYSVVHHFTGKDGYGPGDNLVFDKTYKHLYGTTAAGGSGGYGVVYELTP